jgi:hypothetical protein
MTGAHPSLRYHRPVALFACPFCRDMFEKGEAAACPVCGVPLVAFEKLTASEEALAEDGTPIAPEHEVLPQTYIGRGRGALAALAAAGMVAFFLPWIRETMPDIVDYSGLGIAMKSGWAWGAGVAWFILAPTVLSRRTIMQMRGARLAATFLASFPGMTAAILLARPPHGSYHVPLHFTYGAGLYATLALSVAAMAFGLLFGGPLDEIRVQHGTSRGQTVH